MKHKSLSEQTPTVCCQKTFQLIKLLQFELHVRSFYQFSAQNVQILLQIEAQTVKEFLSGFSLIAEPEAGRGGLDG